MRAELKGLLFDVYEIGEGKVRLWILGDGGRIEAFTDSFRPKLYASGDDRLLRSIGEAAVARRLAAAWRFTTRTEFWSGRRMPVLEIEAAGSRSRQRLVSSLSGGAAVLYNTDIPASSHYMIERGLFPLCACEGEAAGGEVAEISATEPRLREDYPVPDLRMAVVRTSLPASIPLRRGNSLIVSADGEDMELRSEDVPSLLREVNAFMGRLDPHLVVSYGGDGLIVPALLRASASLNIPLLLDREPPPPCAGRSPSKQGRSFFSYGRVLYRSASFPFFGRLHVDAFNSFIFKQTGFAGVLELARLSRIPLQKMARTSPGSAISMMEVAQAVEDGILVPSEKGEPEAFKSAYDLLVADKGGLVFEPEPGIYENVAELDFSAMYPSIMAKRNVSPETVLCGCCANNAVPEAGYNVCEKREGLVPRTIRPVIARRERYRLLRKAAEGSGEKAAAGVFGARADALKWCLVTCFGYLGYRNARFGRIEAHEAVTAFGRDALLAAKETAERAGFHLLHAMTDALWLSSGKPIPEVDARGLCAGIEAATGLPIKVEGIYRWIVFLPSKVRPTAPVAGCYFGAFPDGQLKARGLMCRKHDTVAYAARAQQDALSLLAGAADTAAYRASRERVLALFDGRARDLLEGSVPLHELVVSRCLSRKPEEFKVDTHVAIAARMLRAQGIEVRPGEDVAYVVLREKDRDKQARLKPVQLLTGTEAYDAPHYLKILAEAAAELLYPCGVTREELIERWTGRAAARPRQLEIAAASAAHVTFENTIVFK